MREETNYGSRKAISESLNPKKIYYIFFEGVVTEVEYFKGINENKKKLEINQLIQIRPIARGIKDAGRANITTIIKDIEKWKSKNKDFNPKNDDKIWIIFDRDTLPEEQIDFAFAYTKDKTHFLGFTNPCFELWLLLHLVDVSNLKKEEIRKIKKNCEGSRKYKYIAWKLNQISTNTMIGKHINFDNFIGNIDTAINNESKIENEPNLIKDNLGSNIGSLIQELKQK